MLCSFFTAQGIIFLNPVPGSGESGIQPTPYPIHNTVHGFGITRYSATDPDRSFADAYQLAIEDLNASMMTSVRLEIYGTHTLDPRVRSEFAIGDDPEKSQIVSLDSVQAGNWAIYLIGHKGSRSSIPEHNLSAVNHIDWTRDNAQPVQVDAYWLSAGSASISRYHPQRSFTLAKQQALQTLSLHLQTVVQSMERDVNERRSSISYHTSRNLFTNIHVIKRFEQSGQVYVVVAVNSRDITSWRS
jgi:hypothetical protein